MFLAFHRASVTKIRENMWSRYLDQETAKIPFRLSSQAAIYYYQCNHSKVEAILLNVLPKDTTSERTCRPIFTLSLLNAESQAGKL